MKYLVFVALSLLTLTACKQETYTIDFLKENEEKRTEVLEACKQNKQSNENCENAKEAQRFINEKNSFNKLLGSKK